MRRSVVLVLILGCSVGFGWNPFADASKMIKHISTTFEDIFLKTRNEVSPSISKFSHKLIDTFHTIKSSTYDQVIDSEMFKNIIQAPQKVVDFLRKKLQALLSEHNCNYFREHENQFNSFSSIVQSISFFDSFKKTHQELMGYSQSIQGGIESNSIFTITITEALEKTRTIESLSDQFKNLPELLQAKFEEFKKPIESLNQKAKEFQQNSAQVFEDLKRHVSEITSILKEHSSLLEKAEKHVSIEEAEEVVAKFSTYLSDTPVLTASHDHDDIKELTEAALKLDDGMNRFQIPEKIEEQKSIKAHTAQQRKSFEQLEKVHDEIKDSMSQQKSKAQELISEMKTLSTDSPSKDQIEKLTRIIASIY